MFPLLTPGQNSYGPTSATSARSVGSIHTAPPTSRSKAKRRKHVEQPDDLGEASAFARGFEHDNDQSQHALRHVQFAPDLLEAFGYSATAPTHLGQDMFWDPNASFVETEPTLQRLAEEDAIGSVEVNDDINQTWHSSRSRNMVSGASKAYDRIPPSSNKSKESASSLRQKGGTIREHRSASASVSGSHSYSHKRSSSLRTHENIGVIDPNYLSSSPVKLTETEGAAASIGHGSRWNVKDAQLRSTTEVLPAGSKREKVSRDARRERQTLKPRSNNGADMSFTESVAGLRPGIKRRHTDDNPSFSHSREARPAYIHGGGPQSTQRAPPTRRGRQAGRMGSIQETVDSASQTTVTFTIDENGRARAERKPVMDAGRRSAMVADAEDESEGDSDVSTTDDFAIATSRNTSFTVLGEPQNFASDGRSTGTSAHGRQRLSLQLEDEQYASCRSAAASLPSYVREGRSGRWSGHDPQRSLSRHRQANANVTSFGQDSFVEGETESEAETIVDEPAEKAPTRSSGQLSGQSSRRGGRRGKGR